MRNDITFWLAVSALVLPPATASGSAVLTNTGSPVSIGVNDLGHLITDVGGGYVGIAYEGLGDAITPGCFCEGWGLSGNGVSGYANMNRTGAAGDRLTLLGFASTETSATSMAALAELPQLQITQHYEPAPEAPLNLFENTVTITNTGATPVTDIRYTRVMDWDIPPTPFDELVTIGGREGAANVLYSDNNGFEDGDPLGPRDPFGLTNIDFVDAGPDDHGSIFDLGFGELAPGESITFRMFYGATENEASAMAALAAVGAEVYSLGQSEPGGTPATFIWAFQGVGGTPVVPATIRLGPGAANCDNLYAQTLSVAGLSTTPVASFGFDVVYPPELIVPSSTVPAEIVSTWEVLIDSSSPDRLHVAVISPSYPEPDLLPDGPLAELFWEPQVEVPKPPELPLPVPVSVDVSSVEGLPIPASVESGFVNLGVPQNPKVSVGSTSAFAGDDAVVPVFIEGLCSTDPIFGNYTPHRNYQLEVEFDTAGLGAPTVSLEATVASEWTVVETELRGANRFYMDADALIGDFDPTKDLKDGIIAFLRFPTDSAGPLGSFAVRPTSAFVEAAPIILLGDEGFVEVKDRPCLRPEDVLLSWDDFVRTVQETEPATTNRTCIAAHFSRFVLYEDRLLGMDQLLMTEPLTFETRGSEEDLRRLVDPPGGDPACVDNRVLLTGWVSYGAWNPLFRRPADGEQFLFSSENFARALGRVEPGTEFFRDTRTGALEAFLADKEGQKILPRRNETLFVPNYPEPRGEFPESSPAGLLPMRTTGGPTSVSFWVDDARRNVEYVNDPAARARQRMNISTGGVLTDADGELLVYGARDEKGIYATSCAGVFASTPRLLFKHSSMWGGAHVRGAGELIVNDGELCYISNGSGHYRPPIPSFESLLERYLSAYTFEPLQEYRGISWSVPEGSSRACQALAGREIGLALDPLAIAMRARVNRSVRRLAVVTNYGDDTVDFVVRWPSRATWLRIMPPARRLRPGQSARLNVTGKCGATEGERRTLFWLEDRAGSRISHWAAEVVLECTARERRPRGRVEARGEP